MVYFQVTNTLEQNCIYCFRYERYSDRYEYNGKNRMVYSEVRGLVSISEYVYDGDDSIPV
jgi:hypothetical protein